MNARRLLVTAILLGLGSTAVLGAGDPIQFSTPSKVVTPQKPDPAVPKGAAPQRSKQPGKDELALPPSQPEAVDEERMRRFKEHIDKNKNWMFLRPEDYQGKKSNDTLKEKASGEQKRESTVLERFFENSDSQDDAKKKDKNEKLDQAESDDPFDSDPEERKAPARSELDWKPLFSDRKDDLSSRDRQLQSVFRFDPGALSWSADNFNFTRPDKNPNAAKEERNNKFNELLGVAPPTPLLPNYDSLLSGVSDTTRQPLNPVGANLEELSNATKTAADRSSLFQGSAISGQVRSPLGSLGDELSTKFFGAVPSPLPQGYNVAPAANAPKPGLFEIPRRKF